MADTHDNYEDLEPVVEWQCHPCRVWVDIAEPECPWCGAARGPTEDLTDQQDRDLFADDDLDDDLDEGDDLPPVLIV
jgi:hypothetical protein